MVVIGYCPVTTTQLARFAKLIRTPSDADRLARALHGSFHLAVSVNGKTRTQGSLTGLRRLFYTCLGRVPVVSDRADVLASMTGASINEEVLATRVACGNMLPSPLGEQSLWAGVSAVPPDHYVVQTPNRVREVRWWQPPAPENSLDHGAAAVREALTAGMVGRRPREGRLSADLSGGLDSTSLSFLAARGSPDLLIFRWGEAEAGNDDAIYASHAARSLPHAESLVIPQRELPTIFSNPEDHVDTENPYLFSRTLARTRFSARRLADKGSRWHLAGHGADELFYKFPGYLHRLLRRRPWTAIQHLRSHRSLSRWPLAASISELTRSRDIAQWWRDQASGLTGAALPSRFPPLEWGFVPLRSQAWVSDEAVSAAQAALRRAADMAQPLAADRGQHQFLQALRTNGPAYGQMVRVFAESGIQLQLPYLDDRTVEAALAVRLDERATPRAYKPLLATSMRGIVPDEILRRSTKGEFSEDVRIGLRQNLPAVLDVFTHSALAARGLIDTKVLRKQLLEPQADTSRHIALEHLLGCETWLRATTK
ncbi:asparagine synthase-related protein [Streptomyces huasconensis]|uniref:asparagine synthase-related protein n=1 Tax=Streptomyces huasconensis TaxID=1854574 RepID=UPI0033DFB5B3